MNQVLEWVKINLVIVIFVIVMLAAPVVMFFVAGGMNKKVREEVSARAQSMSQLSSIKVPLPNGQQVLPNDALLQKYEAITRTLADDAAAVQKQALEFNRRGRGVLMPNVFPEPPFEQRQVIPERFHDRLLAAYDELLASVHAGMPPALETLRERLQGTRSRLITQDLKKDPGAPLLPEEDAQIKQKLSGERLVMYRDAAAHIGLYLSKDSLPIPGWDQQHLPSTAQMFDWQWQYWAIEDLLKAIASVNQKSDSVMLAPVKHVLSIGVFGLPAAGGGDEAAAGAGAGSSRLAGSGFGDTGGGAPAAAEGTGAGAGAAAAAGAANPKAHFTPDYSASFSGLVSNPLFDVLTVECTLVVETARLPEVLDAISRYNFNTIINLRVEQADPFAATERGFVYGNEPVCTVTMQMQSVWLRDWTKQFMPPATKAALGIPSDTPPAAAPGPAPAPAG